MSTESPHILIVDDDADIARAVQLLFERQGMTVTHAPDPPAAWVRLAGRPADVILLDLNFARGHTSGEEGFALLDRLIAADRHAVVIVVTGHSGVQVAVQAMRGGAADFIIKPWSNARLTATVERGLALRRAKLAIAPPPPGGEAPLLLGDSAAMTAVRDLIARIAPTDAALLLRGAAGTGKTLAATLAHRGSARAERTLVTLDATAIDPDTITETLAAAAAGGTLLLDQVDRLPLVVQAALVRDLALSRDLRLIATTRLDRAWLREGLHEDLLYRINTIECDLPPLAARDGDAVLLARHFAALFAARHAKPPRPLTVEAERSIAADTWPDNVRGLRQATERAVLLGSGDRLDVADFALIADPAQPRALAANLNLAKSEETLIAAALQRHGFNVSRAAAELGLTRAALYRRMARYGL